MRKKISKSEKARRLLAKGHTPKEVAQLLQCDKQFVYTVRWYDKRKAQGLGSLPVAAPHVPQGGIVVPATPRPRGRPRKNTDASDKREAQMLALPVVNLPVQMYGPEPRTTFWQRLKGLFRG